MLNLMMPLALVLVATSLPAAEPASFTIDQAKNGVLVRFGHWEGLAQKVAYDGSPRTK